ncbi:MAG: glycosyltransferase family 2 protein [Pseudomonadales bacterium]|nr:glycosyltransferase family 2 protein [Pseudomonadales bacterium]
MTRPALSIVVPMYNEADNVRPMTTAITDAMSAYDGQWELICVNDGSADATHATLKAVKDEGASHLAIVDLQRNYGQTAAMQAGIDHARGDIVVTLDGDLQNDPADIPRLVDELIERDLDLLQGWRKERQDDFWLRRFPSVIANWIIRNTSGVKLHDYGCSLKVYRADVLRQVRLYGEMHRFIPVWIATVSAPSRIGETAVNHRARQFGKSHYGLSRTFRVMIDLLAAIFFLRFRGRPGHFFGLIGLWMGFIGGLALGWLAIQKYVLGEDIGSRPLLLVASLLLIAALQFLTTGVLAEMLSRVVFETTNIKPYSVRPPLDKSGDTDSSMGTGRDA